MKKQKTSAGREAFEQYYVQQFGERWDALKKALLQEPHAVSFFAGGAKTYYLDQASVYAAQALPVLEAGRCLDMCAAPGGKTLVLALRMGLGVQITANELSRARRMRLSKVLEEHLPKEQRDRITVTGLDAAVLPRLQTECYDRILLDAPCSSERHVLGDPQYVNVWTAARVKNLAYRQWALLSAAFLLLKAGGFLVYATCALADAENDAVVAKLLKKYRGLVAVREPETLHGGEKTAFGYRFLPDTCGGAGPLFFALLEKTV
ncbi:MAG: SAM-dependent methyltransferase [Treponema sp.]